MESNQNLLNNELIIDQPAAGHLKETAMWARFLGFLGILGSICILLIAIFFKQILEEFGGAYSSNIRNMDERGVLAVSITYGIMALVIFFAALFQLRFGIRAKRAVVSMDQRALTSSLQSLKGYYRIMGIMTIIGILFFVLGLIGMMTMS